MPGSVVAGGLPDTARSLPGQDEEQVRQPVQVAQRLVADGTAAAPGTDGMPLGAPDHGAGEVEHGAGQTRPWDYERRAQRPFTDQVVDDLLDAGRHVGGGQGDPGDQAAALPGAGRQVRGDYEQLPLQPQHYLGQQM